MLGGNGVEVCPQEEAAGSSANGLAQKKSGGRQLDIASMFRR